MILKHAKKAFLCPQKENKRTFLLQYVKKKKNNKNPATKPFWKRGYYILTILKHLHEFCGVEKRTGVNLKTILLLLLCMHSQCLVIPGLWVSVLWSFSFPMNEWQSSCVHSLEEEFFFNSRASMWNAFMLGREELQFNYLTVSLFPNVTEVANCNCLSFLRDAIFWKWCKSPFILSNWGACVKNLVVMQCCSVGVKRHVQKALETTCLQWLFFSGVGGGGSFLGV